MIDPVNTDDNDGTACEGCGERADGVSRVVGRAYDVPLCKDCQDSLIAPCDGCGRTMWQSEGINVFANSNRYCANCAKPVMAVAVSDIDQVRR